MVGHVEIVEGAMFLARRQFKHHVRWAHGRFESPRSKLNSSSGVWYLVILIWQNYIKTASQEEPNKTGLQASVHLSDSFRIIWEFFHQGGDPVMQTCNVSMMVVSWVFTSTEVEEQKPWTSSKYLQKACVVKELQSNVEYWVWAYPSAPLTGFGGWRSTKKKKKSTKIYIKGSFPSHVLGIFFRGCAVAEQ